MKQLSEPYSIDGKPVFIGFLKSRSLDWIIKKQIFKGMKIKRVVLDGKTVIEHQKEPINISLKKSKPKLKFMILREKNEYIRLRMLPSKETKDVKKGKKFWSSYYLIGDDINLEELFEKFKVFNPQTLFIKEIEAWVSDNLHLIFRDKFTTDSNIRKVIEKEKNTRANPLFLQYIYEEKTLRGLRKGHFHKKFVIAAAVKGAEDIIKFKIVENGDSI